jgi:hypothetical protein
MTQEINVAGTPPALVTDRAEVSTGLSRGDDDSAVSAERVESPVFGGDLESPFEGGLT